MLNNGIQYFIFTLSIPGGHGSSEGLTGIDEIGCIGGGTSPTGSSPSSPFDGNRWVMLELPPHSLCVCGVSSSFTSLLAASVPVAALPPPLLLTLLPIPVSADPPADPAADS